MRTRISALTSASIGQEVTVKGWVRTVRDQKKFAFIEINDGSQLNNLQVVVDGALEGYEQILGQLSVGASVAITGTVVKSPAQGQPFELKALQMQVLGTCDPKEYPLQKKHHSLEFLRTIAHLRPRTNTIGAVMRVRNALAFAAHKFFQERGFIYLNTPIITGSDCEGAGQMFRVTTLDLNNPPRCADGSVDFSKDFFGTSAFLTVSGQLNEEAYACALSDTYTFGPTFRAENSNTSRHLAEFWMIEPEMAFADLTDDMECAQSFLKYVIAHVLEHCGADLEFCNKHIDTGLLERLRHVVDSDFAHVTYTEAITLLEKAPRAFEFPVAWGTDLQSEHERYLAEEYFKRPVIVTNYPVAIKAFYMRADDNGETVSAMDVLVAGVGELVGGSQREERLDRLEQKIVQMGLPLKDYWWYLDLRKYGTVPHAGFGAGFERLVQFVTGVDNIRETIPFPRYPGHAEF